MDKVTNASGAEFDIAYIPDLWHVAMSVHDLERDNGRERGADGSEDILTVWHQAHAMRDEITSLRAYVKNIEKRLHQECRRGDALAQSSDSYMAAAQKFEGLLKAWAEEVDRS